ncbi:Fis family transcriptional regulator [Paenibacillus swuensis]|uniref:Fis family transcriptional regulator n=1 Tax=Paenibacillus swuensis TaxID=1178515 RepID=A0A172TKS9_9BACL|nr:YifB family Mg chelatase-like AAA ATPase [Paenibacillus swuensis]ANE47524.1 Fis family transcriptional regulator [Paenibacillus swuensis]
MYSKMICACVDGIDGKLIDVEVDVSNGLPQVNIVGLPDSAVRESSERVRSAIKNCRFEFPMERITVNLAPADVRKEGSSFDLAIAIGILSASDQVKLEDPESTLIIGELALNGDVRPVPGVLSMADQARKSGLTRMILPYDNVEEAQFIEGLTLYPIRHLHELHEIVTTGQPLVSVINNKHVKTPIRELLRQGLFGGDPPPPEDSADRTTLDYADVIGQQQAKRALMIAAAGMHNLLFIGPPGSGKTMLIRRLPSILPELMDNEALEVTKIYSVSGKLHDRSRLLRERPFRSPHHTVSAGGLIGGGSIPKPGEVTLAHRGVLFLDELPEFTRGVLEVMRQPLEDRHVVIGRARAVVRFPADFMLAASMNPCPCGQLGADPGAAPCTCSLSKIQHYRSRISGPLLDRIDLHVEVPRVTSLAAAGSPLGSREMREKVLAAQSRQRARYAGTGVVFNGELTGNLLRRHCRLRPEGERLLEASFVALQLSLRAHDRILRIARTIADLEDSVAIETAHVAEAVQYRNLDKKYDPA